jgi:hypothetical protein
MRCWVNKVQARYVPRDAMVLVPASEVDQEQFDKLAMGVDLRADVVQPRNGKLHRKAFVLLAKVLPHTEYPNQELLRKAMTIGAGFVESVIDPGTGEIVWTPKSWEFASMDDVEFRELYSALIDVALRIVPGSSREGWEEAVDDICRM